MSRWLHSGRRRDACALIYEAGEIRAQQLKNRLAEHTDERVDPRTYRGMLDAMADAGFIEVRVDGIADVVTLTDAGERRLLEHHDWLSERVANGRERGECDGKDGERGEKDGDRGE